LLGENKVKIYKTRIIFAEANFGKIMPCDTIEHNGKFWLVPEWKENTTTKTRAPLRIICLDCLPHQKTGPDDPHDFIVNTPIPSCVFEGIKPSEEKYQFDIIEFPDISFDIPE
jgi:hypothetical protein